MIKFSKNFLLNPAQIRISGIKCNFDNIAKIANVFDCKWIVLTIDSLTEESPLLSYIKEQGSKFFVKQHSAIFAEVSVLIPYTLFGDVLAKAISEDPENIFVFNLLDSTNWDIYLQHSLEELVATGITNVFISVSFDENALLISVNKSLIHPQGLYRKIKALQFK